MESKNEILDAATLHVRAVSAAVRCLEGKGYTVIERDFITEIDSSISSQPITPKSRLWSSFRSMRLTTRISPSLFPTAKRASA